MATQTTPIVQQPQASTYNHPREDLLDGGRRREYLDIGVPLYRASMEGDLEAAKVILQGREYLVRCSITEKKDTPLHVAAARQSTKFVRYLVNMMNEDDLKLQNQDGNTAFCIAAISGNVDMVEIMFEKNQALTTIRGSKNMMPIYLVAFHGNKDMVTKLYNMSNKLTGWTNDEIDEVLLICIQSDNFDVALSILEDNEELPHDKHAWDVLHVLARKPDAFHDGPYRPPGLMGKSLASLGLGTKNNIKETDAVLLLRVLWKRIVGKPKDVVDGILRGPMIEKDKMETYPSQILFIAAKMDNRVFLVELIGEYPDLVLMKNDDGQTIFHIAVSHRHRKVFSLLYSTGSMKHLITSVRDQQGNNILHLVGKDPEKNAYENSVTTPFQMFSEHFWYQEVEHIVPPPCREVKNAAGETPLELFTKNHKKLVSDGLKSINDTINISTVVAALVCTVAFSVVYSIPGGFDQNNGYPMLLRHNYFIAFVVLDVLSFISSTGSIVNFLSVILSRHHQTMDLLYKRWSFGLILLMYSIYFVTIAFILSFFILYLKSSWKYIFYVVTNFLIGLYTAVLGSITQDVFQLKDPSRLTSRAL